MTSLGPATLMTLSPLVPPQIRAEADRQLKALVGAWQDDIEERDALRDAINHIVSVASNPLGWKSSRDAECRGAGWHVNDGPPCSGMYLVTVWYYGGTRLVQTANYRGNGNWYVDDSPISVELSHVKAWRPLIEPYAGDKS